LFPDRYRLIKYGKVKELVLRSVIKHIDVGIQPGASGVSYGPMYSMHRYWSKKPSEVIAEYIKAYTEKGDVILDPFSGYGVTAIEALRLGRRAIAIDLNPMATFMTKVIFEPVNLPNLRWAFQDIMSACQSKIFELFTTECPKCSGKGIIDFVVRENDKPIQVAYGCDCSNERLFKEPDVYDKGADDRSAGMQIPFWYPSNVPLPPIQKERFEYFHELFTRRNLIALSIILHAIQNLTDERVCEVMKLAFTSSLDKCSRLKPLSYRARGDGQYSLSESWVAVRFYAPPLSQEVNPWNAFRNIYERVYEGKKESNDVLRNVSLGHSYKDLESGNANAVILTGSADRILNEELPEDSIDYVLTDPPFGSAVQYLPLSAFWGAWLGFDFDYENEIVVAPRRGKTFADYSQRLQSVFRSLHRVSKDNSYVHMFYNDVKGPYLHNTLDLLEREKIVPEHILHQPPPKSFGYAAQHREGHYGSYVIRGLVHKKEAVYIAEVSEEKLSEAIAKIAQINLSVDLNIRETLTQMARRFPSGDFSIPNVKTTPASILHEFYKQLNRDEILAFTRYKAEEFLLKSVAPFAKYNRSQRALTPLDDKAIQPLEQNVFSKLRDAVLNAESLLEREQDIVNRVHQLAIRHIGSNGLSPEHVRAVRNSIHETERSEYFRERRIALLCDFGEGLGLQSSAVDNGWTGVSWANKGDLTCNFELQKDGVRVFSDSNTHSISEWGTIPYYDLECKMREWCLKNPAKGKRLLEKLNPIEGPSYAISMKHGNGTTTSQQQSLKLKVKRNRQVCPQHFIMQVEIPRKLNLSLSPGQFFHIVCDVGGNDEHGYPLTLRRPFSFHGIQHEGFNRSALAKAGCVPTEIREILRRRPSNIDFLYKIVGEGTSKLSEVKEGVKIDAIGPCGNGFIIGSERAAVIVAGGIGIAPLVGLVERLRYLDKEVYIYLGALKKELLALAVTRPDSIDINYANGSQEFYDMIRRDFLEIGAHEPIVCTDDGSVGEKGVVTDILERDIREGRVPRSGACFYACGPRGMLQVISDISLRCSVECQVLLEEHMACGIGACLSCSCEIRRPDGRIEKKRVCKDGPVFKATEVIWKALI
jgi:NAD(P)H-flavin reductase/DNA modification methylase